MTAEAHLIQPYGDRAVLACPVCGFGCTHVEAVSMIDGRGRVHTTYPGDPDGGGMHSEDSLNTAADLQYDRAHTVRLTGWCEGCFCCWFVDLATFKGQTFIDLALAPCPGTADLPSPRDGGEAA